MARVGVVTVTIASEPRPGNRRNEDLALFVDDLACVLDGASLPRAAPCGHDSAWYVRVLAKYLVAAYAEDSRGDLTELLREAIRRSVGEHAVHCDHPEEPMRAASTVVLTRRGGRWLDYLVLCDSALLIDGEGGPHVVTDERIAELPLRAGARIRGLLARGGGFGQEYTALLDQQVRELDTHRNAEGGYWVAADDPAAADEAITGSVGLADVALVTDGSTRAVTALGSYADWGELMRDLHESGPEPVIAGVRRAERADPEGYRWPRGTPYDDATALVWIRT